MERDHVESCQGPCSTHLMLQVLNSQEARLSRSANFSLYPVSGMEKEKD